MTFTAGGEPGGVADLLELIPRLAIDAAAIVLLAQGLFLRRHGRGDLVALHLFNLGVFAAVAVIARSEVSLGVGFGLFAVLSIVRLRSETFTHVELGYCFLALVLALVCAIDAGGPAVAGTLAGVLLLAAAVFDHPRLASSERRLEVTLERAVPDLGELRRELEARLGAQVTDVAVLELDYVRDTTRVAARCVACQGLHAVA